MVQSLMITEGHCISAYKNTPGPSEKEYDFWQQVLGAAQLAPRCEDPDTAAQRMRTCSAATAWQHYLGAKYPHTPYGLVPDIEIWKKGREMTHTNKFKMEVKLGNAAMLDKQALIALMRKTIERLERHDDNFTDKVRLRDDNGNTVGYYRLYKGMLTVG